MLAEIAADLGVDREDLDFADVTYYQGSEFLIENEFDAGYAQLSSVRSELACALARAPGSCLYKAMLRIYVLDGA